MKTSQRRGDEKPTLEAKVSDEKLWIVLRRAYQSITECLENGVIARGIAVSEFIVLEVFLHSGALTTLEISQKTRLAAASVEATTARLQEQELISVQPRQAGEGKDALDLSEHGRRSIEWLYEEHLKDIAGILDVLSGERRFDLYRSMREVGRSAESRRVMPTVKTGGGLTPWQLRRATEFMRRHMAHSITTKEVAASIELSDSHFRKAFKSSTGVTPHNHLLRLRITEAQRLLKEGAVPMSDIASATGFGDQSHFSRTFQKVIGISPRAWQRDHHLR